MTSILHNALVLLGAREELHRVWGRFDHERPGISTNQLVVAVVLIAIASVAAIFWRFQKSHAAQTFSSNSAAKLFRELCAAHGLKRSARRLLKQLAAARGVADPATLFVEPRYFEMGSLPREMKESAKDVRALSERLFR